MATGYYGPQYLGFIKDFPGYSLSLQPGFRVWRMPYRIWRSNSFAIAYKDGVQHQPIQSVHRTTTGTRMYGYARDFYDRIHVMPGVIAFGAILGAQKRQIEVWNAYFQPHAYLSRSVNNPSGTTLTPVTDDAPMTLGPLRSLRYTLDVGTAGPPQVAAIYLFQFDTEAPTLTVTGQRTAVFSFPPNWANPVTERIKWLTAVLTSWNGREQRIARRLVPRRSLEFTVASFREHYQYLDSLLVGWQARLYAFPFWPDAQQLPAEVAAGETYIPLNTDSLDYYVGGYAIFYNNPLRTEAAEILEVHPDHLILTKGLDRNWAQHSTVAPARLGRLDVQVTATNPTARLRTMVVSMDIEDITNFDPLPEPSTYRGSELVLRRPNRAEDVTTLYQRLQQRLDYDETIIDIVDKANRSFSVRTYQFLLKDKPAIYNYRRWLAVRQGQLKPFWMPTHENAIDVVGPTIAGDTSLVVAARGYASLLEIDDSRKNIALLHKDGTWLYRQVTEFGQGETEDTERVFIDGVVGRITEPGDFIYGCFLEYVVLNQDEIEISYLKNNAATTTLSTRSVIQ